ncbi:hypothetical protein MC885_020649 [Smutsia gigantea]|nr:hypothetical protein MC885_020649 [Smutsia gigantea]
MAGDDLGRSLAELEVLCTHLYIGTDLSQRIEAEKALLELIDSPECLSKCQLLLEQGRTSYAQLLAATCLSKLVSRVSPLPIEQRIDIRNYILHYVASQPQLAPFVIQALIQVIAKISKLGWFEVQKDQFVFREIIADVKKFLQGTVEHCITGVIILSELTQEMNLVDCSRPSAKHRKTATSFRDTSLKDILVLACSLLKEILAKPLNLQDQGQQNLLIQVLKLVLNCLNFDFIGNSADESADDHCTVQIPTTWRTIFLEPETLDLFFNLYHSLSPLLSQMAPCLWCSSGPGTVSRSGQWQYSPSSQANPASVATSSMPAVQQQPRHLLACGTYQLRKPGDQPASLGSKSRLDVGEPQIGVGRLYLYSFSEDSAVCPLVEIQRRDISAILDLKWCHIPVASHALLGVAGAGGTIELLCMRPEYTGKHTACSYTREDSAPREACKIRSRDLAGPEHSPTPAHRREERIQSREGVEVHPAK